MSGNDSKIPVGTILVGKYRVVREIGRGGMAAVYEAMQLSLDKKVAVKVLAAELAASTIVIERFFREARAAASVRSPYIVDVYDSGRLDDGRPFIAMELLEGESLYDRMARVRIIDLETTIRVIVHTSRGLVKAHSSGIVHRDLKPENIFLTKGEDQHDIVKILDFGLAKFYAPVNPEEKAAKRLTREGAVFGTPAYMSPEQVKGQGNVDHRADLWALGCMAYECLIGRPVWNMDQGVAMTFASIATGPIPVPSQQRADLPPSFDAWFKKCLERDPANRYQSAKELADAFVEAWGQRPVSSASFPGLPLGTGPHPRISPQGAADVLALQPSAASARGMNMPAVPSSRRAVDGPLNGGRASTASEPLPLVNGRASTDIPTTTSQPDEPPPRKLSPVRLALASGFLVLGVSMAIFVWVSALSPQIFAPIVASTTSGTPIGVNTTANDLPPPDEPKWVPILAEGQRLFSVGDYAAAQKKFKEAAEQGPAAAKVAAVFTEQVKVAEKSNTANGPCKAVAFAHPRLETNRRAGVPAIAPISKGALVTWIDDHERQGSDHAYGVAIDPTGKSLNSVRDLTPDATSADTPKLAVIGSDRLVLVYQDEKGKEAGVHARLLDGNGNIDQYKGQVVRIGGNPRPGQFFPAVDKGPEGFWVVWQDDRDKENDHDLYARHISNELGTVTPDRRLTDYYAPPRSKNPPPRVKHPSVAVAANTLLVAYKLESESGKDKTHAIMRMRVSLEQAEKGLDENTTQNRGDRTMGDVSMVSEEKTPADAPAIACGNDGCFIVWHVEAGGASIAKIDPVQNKVLWRKVLSSKGGHPSLGVNNGQVAVAWYEKPYIKFTTLNDGGPVLPPSSAFRIFDPSVPPPSISAGAEKNEWYLAWQDSDTAKGTPEIYAARLTCR
ncbi:MAG: serine/threonine protein kinase [Labilithrix sp.]|nr:serine/threonine protein kinase [Labilithrix sp.]MCW5817947.1 serine/threonine protein kinase [Labilithrix sp.]